MNKCVVCGTYFKPLKEYPERRTCSDECLRIHMRNLTPETFLEKSFKNGNIPFNKGVPQKEWMSDESRDKCSKTHIHKQNCVSPLSKMEGRYLPFNAKVKGTVTRRITKHKHGKNAGKTEINYYINIDWHGNRKPNNLYKRYLWEYYHQQDIPKGYVIYSLDGNPENFDKDNLILMSRKQLAILNKSGVFPDEL